ncbi:hypothetical protein ACFL59_08345 [Planctomycetota bacterium]
MAGEQGEAAKPMADGHTDTPTDASSAPVAASPVGMSETGPDTSASDSAAANTQPDFPSESENVPCPQEPPSSNTDDPDVGEAESKGAVESSDDALGFLLLANRIADLRARDDVQQGAAIRIRQKALGEALRAAERARTEAPERCEALGARAARTITGLPRPVREAYGLVPAAPASPDQPARTSAVETSAAKSDDGYEDRRRRRGPEAPAGGDGHGSRWNLVAGFALGAIAIVGGSIPLARLVWRSGHASLQYTAFLLTTLLIFVAGVALERRLALPLAGRTLLVSFCLLVPLVAAVGDALGVSLALGLLGAAVVGPALFLASRTLLQAPVAGSDRTLTTAGASSKTRAGPGFAAALLLLSFGNLLIHDGGGLPAMSELTVYLPGAAAAILVLGVWLELRGRLLTLTPGRMVLTFGALGYAAVVLVGRAVDAWLLAFAHLATPLLVVSAPALYLGGRLFGRDRRRDEDTSEQQRDTNSAATGLVLLVLGGALGLVSFGLSLLAPWAALSTGLTALLLALAAHAKNPTRAGPLAAATAGVLLAAAGLGGLWFGTDPALWPAITRPRLVATFLPTGLLLLSLAAWARRRGGLAGARVPAFATAVCLASATFLVEHGLSQAGVLTMDAASLFALAWILDRPVASSAALLVFAAALRSLLIGPVAWSDAEAGLAVVGLGVAASVAGRGSSPAAALLAAPLQGTAPVVAFGGAALAHLDYNLMTPVAVLALAACCFLWRGAGSEIAADTVGTGTDRGEEGSTVNRTMPRESGSPKAGWRFPWELLGTLAVLLAAVELKDLFTSVAAAVDRPTHLGWSTSWTREFSDAHRLLVRHLSWAPVLAGLAATAAVRLLRPRESRTILLVSAEAFGVGGGVAGAFGSRWGKGNLEQHGGSKRTEAAVIAALDWLARHQGQDGAWRSHGFSERCDAKQDRCWGPDLRTASGKGPGLGDPRFDVGITSLALLAFLGNGHTHKFSSRPELRRVVGRGIGFLKLRQAVDGAIGFDPEHGESIYNHVIATVVLCDLCAISRDPLLRTPAQQAVSWLVKAQNPGLGWRYGVRPGRSDTSMTGWAVMALATARVARLEVPDEAFLGALAWFDRVTLACDSPGCPAGLVGYMGPGDGGSMLNRKQLDHPESYPSFVAAPTMTAVAAYSRVLAGQPRTHRRIRQGLEIVSSQLPRRDAPGVGKKNQTNFYYWYCGSSAVFGAAGPASEAWRLWNESLIAALLDGEGAQRSAKGDCAVGSWDPVGEWGLVESRVGATALNALTLETYYRLDPK